ncbi:MAG: M48 family metallopeptidase [bacterium]
MDPAVAKRYQYQKLVLSMTKTVVTLIFLFFVVQTGLSLKVMEVIRGLAHSWPLQLLLFILFLGAADFLLNAPFSFYSGYLLEHRYELSNQSFGRYLWEEGKSILMASVLGIPIIFLLYFLILKSPRFYWAYTASFLFFFSVILAQIAPKVLLPLFYKMKPLADETLKERLKGLCGSEGFTLKEVFSFDMSKNTRKANAAFLGLGRTRTIILADTLLEKFTPDEIESVFTHEMGHLVRRHILKQVLIGLVTNFGGLYLTAWLYEKSAAFFGGNIADLALLPLFFFWLVLWGLVMMPIGNSISRRFEWEADDYACQKSPKPMALIGSFHKLAELNLADPSPPAWVEFLFYSHPAIQKRIAHVEQWLKS